MADQVDPRFHSGRLASKVAVPGSGYLKAPKAGSDGWYAAVMAKSGVGTEWRRTLHAGRPAQPSQ